MKAACGPHSNSHRRHGYSTNSATSLSKSKHVNTSSHTSPKMVMPPFLRLDSTGEVSDDRPGQTGSAAPQSQHRADRTAASNIKLLPKMVLGLPHHQTNPAARHLTASKTVAEGGISALDDLINSSQALNNVTKGAMRSPVKMAHQSHLTKPRSNRYGQWGGVIGQPYGYFPPGVFPCHMFTRLCIPSTSGQGVHKAAWVTGMNLMNTCEQFAVHVPPVPSVQFVDNSVLCNRSASSSPQRDSKSFSSQSPSVSQGQSPTRGKPPTSKTESIMKPPMCSILPGIHPDVEGSPEPRFSEEEESVCSMSSSVPENCKRKQDSSPADSTISTRDTMDYVVPSCAQKDTTSTLAEPLPSTSHDCKGNDVLFSCAAVDAKPPVSLCVTSSNVSASKAGENQSDNQNDSQCSKLSQFSDLVGDDLEVDWGDDTDEYDEIDEVSEAEAWNCFQFGLLHENNLLSKPKKEEVEEEGDGVQQVKSPPKPDHAANERWNKHHPPTVPSDRKTKVQFSCGAELDRVHFFERDTMTMMEIQKLRDISRANEGLAGHILRKKRLDASDEDDTSGSECSGSPQKSDLAQRGMSDVCNGAAGTSQMNKDCSKAVKTVERKDDVDGVKPHAEDDSEDEDDDVMFGGCGCVVSTESESDDEDDWEDEEEEDEEEDGFVIAFE